MIGEDILKSEWIRTIKHRYYRLGCSYIVIGILSFVIPLFVDISGRAFIGSVFLVLGALVGWNSYEGFSTGDRPWSQTLIFVTTWIAGLVFLFHPLAEVIMISFFISTYFFVDGIMRVLEFVRLSTMKGAFWILISGLMEAIFGFVTWGSSYITMPEIKVVLSIYLIVAGFFTVLSSRN